MDFDSISELSAEKKCQDKIWRVRLDGYEEILEIFQQQLDEESREFSKNAELVQKFAMDKNAVALEKGLTVILYFVENAACAPATAKNVMSDLVGKCFSSPRTKTRELALKIALKYVEIGEKYAVSEELLKGLENKSPKVVATSLEAVQGVINAFGLQVISRKSLIKELRRLLEHKYKIVREESKRLCLEMYTWLGDDLIAQLQTLRPAILSELKCALRNTRRELPVSYRCKKSQPKCKVDPYNLMPAVDVLSLLTKDFYIRCGAEKWRDRQEALDTLLQLITNVKLESGNYWDIVRTLNILIREDCNILNVTSAIKCLTNLVYGLGRRLQPHASACIPTIFNKFKVKNQKVVAALRKAIDAIYGISSFDVMLEDIKYALDSKNPKVKAETCAFLTRCFYTCSAAQLNMRLLRTLTKYLLIALNDKHSEVREYSAEALGTALKVAGKSTMSPFLCGNKAIKMAKVKYFYDKAVFAADKEHGQSPALPKHLASNQARLAMRGVKSNPNSTILQTAASPFNVKQKLANGSEPEMFTSTLKFVQEVLTGDKFGQISEYISSEVIKGVSSGNQSVRLYFVEKFSKKVRQLEKSFIPANSCIQILAKTPGFKDEDSRILKLRFETLIYIAKNAKISQVAVESCLFDIVNKIGDDQVGAHAASALTVLSESTSLDYISLEVLKIVFSQTNLKNQSGALIWLSTSIKQFGLQIQVEEVIEHVKEALSSDKAVLRKSVLVLFGTMYAYVGKFLFTFFEKENPNLL